MKKVRNILLKTFVIVLVVVLAVFDCIHVAHADGAIGSVGGVNFDNFEKLCDAVKNSKDKTITIEMYCDWDEYKDSQFDRRLYVPENCEATLNMHGHRFDRNNVKDDDYSDNGELIYVETGATLTINGSSNNEEKERVHEGVRVFTDVNQKNATNFINTKGGTLAGGNSSAGPGAIYIDSGKNVTLNSVTIAGCKASYFWDPFISYTGYGGAILITEDNTSLNLNNSIITGCLAQEDGGGIYAKDDDNICIYLDNSKIDNNYSESDGGGINLDGENLLISATNKSSISGNKTKGYGGGIYLWNDDVTVYAKNKGDLTIDGNSAEYGGGIYLDEEDSKIENLIITNNTATKQGGGVYVDNDYTTINNCTITGNNKYGVYIDSDCDVGMYVTGSTIIKDNASGNLTLADNSVFLNFNQNDQAEVHLGYLSKPDNEGYFLTKEQTPDYTSQLFADDSEYVVVYNYHDKTQDDGRRLIYIKKSNVPEGYKVRENPETITIKTQDAHAYADDINKVFAGMYTEVDGVSSGTQYQLRTIYPHHCTTPGDRSFKLYYSDGLFFDNPIIYNNHLATVSYGLASSGAYLNGYDDYYKHGGARQFMADIGCPDQMIYVNDNNINVPGTDTIGVTIGSKTLQAFESNELVNTEYTLVAIATRGANYGDEWASNVTLGIGDERDGEAQGFSEAADQVMEALHQYIDIHDLSAKLEEGKVKFWISGFSRGGATANIVAKRVIEEYCYKINEEGQPATGNAVFAYPLEAPQGGTDKAEKLSDKTKYYSIHNLINTGDLVPYVGPKDMGFKRYGVDHYIPGTYLGRMTLDEYKGRINTKQITPKGASEVSNITTVTTYSDNEPLSTKKEMDSTETDSYKEYCIRRDNMIDYLATINHNALFFDYFQPFGTDIYSPFYEKVGLFDGAKLEDYLANLLPFAQQEAFSGSGYREKYVNDFQRFARAYYAAETDKEGKMILDTLQKMIDKILHSDPDTIIMLFNVFGDYFNMDQEAKDYVIQHLWNIADVNGAFDDLTAAQRDVVREHWTIVADAIFNFTDGDWQLGYYDQGVPTFPETGKSWVNGDIGGYGRLADNLIYSLTLYMNANMIIDINHSREVGMAWTKTYDNYYSESVEGNNAGKLKENTYFEYQVNWVNGNYNPDNYTVAMPDAYIKEDNKHNKQLEASQNPNQYNIIEPGQKIILEVGQIHDDVSPVNITQGDGDVLGEAIYYEIYDANKEFMPLLEKDIYRGGIYLPSSEEGDAYRVVAKAISLGKESKEATYYFKVQKGHEVIMFDGSSIEPVIYRYHSGDNVTISANPSDLQYFERWKVQLLNEDNVVVAEDIAQIILDGKQTDFTTVFVMPEVGIDTYDEEGHTYPDNYKLVIEAKCGNVIELVKTTEDFHAPEPKTEESQGQALIAETTIVFDNDVTKEYPIVWTYTYDGKTYPATDTVYSGVDYIATIVMPKDQANKIAFAPTEYLSAIFNGNEDDKSKIKDDGISIVRNDSDGSATLVIQFKTTKEGGDTPPPEADITLTVKAFDLNLNDYLSETASYQVHQGQEILLTAPAVNDEVFSKWNFGETGIVLAEGYVETDKTVKVIIPSELTITELSIDAQYIPVINSITAIVEAPEPGQPMQSLANEDTLKVTITNKYEIDPVYVKIDWSPKPTADGKADYLTSYTATIGIEPVDGKIKARIEGQEDYIETTATFLYSESVTATINGLTASLDKNKNSVSYTFPVTAYTLEKIYPPEEVKGVPYGATAEDIMNYLPTVKILLNDGRILTTSVSWDTPQEEFGPDEYSSKTWLADGTVNLPYGVKKKSEDQSLAVVGKVVVNAAESVKRAIPSVDPGIYQNDQRVSLSSETEGASILYTTKQNSTPDDWKSYDGILIPINRKDAVDEIDPKTKEPTGKKMVVLQVYTFKDGMRPDGPRQYAYIFSKEVNVPKGQDHIYNGDPQIGVVGDSAYTLEPISDGVQIDENGNATAINPGTYKVKAMIKDGNTWEIIDPETGERSYTSDDQVITFIIAEIPKRTITYKLDGGIYDRSGADIVEIYPIGSEITIHAAPTKDGYEFLYWRGSEYYPGDKYKVKDNHTFVAVWKKVGPDPIPPYNPPRTGIK